MTCIYCNDHPDIKKNCYCREIPNLSKNPNAEKERREFIEEMVKTYPVELQRAARKVLINMTYGI